MSRRAAAAGRAGFCFALGLLASAGAAGGQPGEPLPCAGFALVDVTGPAGIEFVHEPGRTARKHLPETMGSGLAWIDFDGDGWLDLYLVQSGPFPPADGARPDGHEDRLFRNPGASPESGVGRWQEVSHRAGTGRRDYGQGAVAADVDGDGDLDLYLTAYGRDALLINRGDGTFDERAADAGLVIGGWSSSAAFADADGDGDLDLYVTRYVEYDPHDELFCGDLETGERAYCDPSLFAGAGDRFLRNRGDGSFVDATTEAGLAGADGKGLGVLFTDLDGDRLPDLYVANDLTLNLLFRNAGDGRFEDVSLLAGAAVNAAGKPEAGMGLAVGDVDGDGDPDLAVTNFDVETNTLYENLGGLIFDDVSPASGFGPPSLNLLGFGVALADLDRDGDLDGYVGNGHIFDDPRRDHVAYRQPDLLLAGDGSGVFAAQACGRFADGPRVTRGIALADWDNDGDPDLALSHNGDAGALLRNDAGGGERWLGLTLAGSGRGAGSAAAAIGARVELTTERGRQVRWVTAGDSYQSSSDPRVLFAWPDGDRPLAVDVSWPSGRRQRLLAPVGSTLPAATYLRLVEPAPAR